MKWLMFLIVLGIVMAIVLSHIMSAIDSSAVNDMYQDFKRKPRLDDEWPEMDGSSKKLFWIVQVKCKVH